VLAQRVTRDLMTRIIDANVQERGIMRNRTSSFLKQQAEEAAAEWARQFEALRKAQPGTAAYERLAFDRELARRRYEQLRTMECFVSFANAGDSGFAPPAPRAGGPAARRGNAGRVSRWRRAGVYSDTASIPPGAPTVTARSLIAAYFICKYFVILATSVIQY